MHVGFGNSDTCVMHLRPATLDVIAGLDPAIHRLAKDAFAKWMDARVEPAHDGSVERRTDQQDSEDTR